MDSHVEKEDKPLGQKDVDHPEPEAAAVKPAGTSAVQQSTDVDKLADEGANKVHVSTLHQPDQTPPIANDHQPFSGQQAQVAPQINGLDVYIP